VVITLEFDIAKQGILIEQVMLGKGLYIQAGREGDRFINDPDRPKILLYLAGGDTGFREWWDSMFRKQVEKDLRTRGLSKSDARRATRTAIEEIRNFGSFRMRDVVE
jgi:hypothetical protein